MSVHACLIWYLHFNNLKHRESFKENVENEKDFKYLGHCYNTIDLSISCLKFEPFIS